MSDNLWPYKHTTVQDWGEYWHLLDPELMEKADIFIDLARTLTGDDTVALHINVAYATHGHLNDSQHYSGLAFDGYLHGKDGYLPLIVQLFCALKAGFRGVGCYPDWNTPGVHCDVRLLGLEEPVHTWVRRQNQYLPIDQKELNILAGLYFKP